MKRVRLMTALFLLVSLVLAGCGSSASSTATPQKSPTPSATAQKPDSTPAAKENMIARVGIGSTNSLIYLPVSVAKARNLFEQEALVIENPNFKGGAQIAQALVEGNLDFALFSYNHVVKYQTQGVNLTVVAMIAELPGSALVVDVKHKDQIKSLSDLKGLKVGVTSPGSGSHDALLTMLRSAGLSAQDVTIEGVGFNLAKAFTEERVTVGVTYEPWVSILTESGKGVLLSDARADLRTEEGVQALYGADRFPMTTLVTSPTLVSKNPELVQRMVNAIVSANAWIAKSTPEQIAAVVPDSDKGDPLHYVASLRHSKGIISPTGKMDTNTVNVVARDLKGNNSIPESASINVQAIVESRFVNQAVIK